jgi:hypothetical protein
MLAWIKNMFTIDYYMSEECKKCRFYFNCWSFQGLFWGPVDNDYRDWCIVNNLEFKREIDTRGILDTDSSCDSDIL